MALKERINADLKTALLGGDHFAVEVLRSLKAAILNQEVSRDKRAEGLGDSEIEKVITHEIKQRRDSIEQYSTGGRPELAASEQKEADLLMAYLPKQLSETELRKIIDTKKAELGTEVGPRLTGQLIGLVKKEVGSAADGGTIAKLVKEAVNE